MEESKKNEQEIIVQDTLGTAFKRLICFKAPVMPPDDEVTTLKSSEPKQRLIYILLAIFLGGFGVHNFYAGYKKRAIAELIVSGALLVLSPFSMLLCFIPCIFYLLPTAWLIFDIIKIDKDAAGRPMK